MNSVNKNSVNKMIDLLSSEGAKTTFVFTSEVVARSYLEACARRYPNKAIFSDSAISWDTFQEKFTPYPRDKVKAVFTDRLLFVQHFFASKSVTKSTTINATNSSTKSSTSQDAMSQLKYYCDSNYACSKPAYMRSIAKALPHMCKAFDLENTSDSLTLLDKTLQHAPKEMQADLLLLVPAYKAYLDQQNLYEPALYEPNFHVPAADGSLASNYTLVFPQTFSKSAVLKALEVCPHVDLEPHEEALKLKLFNNSLSEIRACLRSVYALLTSGTHPNDIAITCSDYDAYKPYLDQEAQKRDITLTFNNAKPISSYTPGAFFCALERVKAENYSFKSMKALLLDLRFPYKNRELLVSIIQKAVDCKCQDGPLSNWIAKFKKLGASAEAERLEQIETGIKAVVDCKDPLQLRENVMILVKDLFGEDEWTKRPDENDSLKAQNARIFGSCARELDNLSAHAKGLDVSGDISLFSLFVDILRDKVYRPNTGKNNINVYKYPADAGLAVKYHFTLGLTDSNTKVLLNPYPFLPLDTAKTMEEVRALEDSVLSLYGQTLDGGFSWMSSAEEGFSGADVVPTLFLKGDRIEKVKKVECDSFEEEISVWKGKKELTEGQVLAITQKQKDCFERAYQSELDFSNETSFAPVATPFKISVSRVKELETCPYRGYAYCKLGLNNLDFEPNMADAAQIGDLLHEALQKALKEAKTLDNIKPDRLQELFNLEVDKYEKEAKATDSVHVAYIRHKYSELLPNLISCFEEKEGDRNLDNGTARKLGGMDFKAKEYTAPAIIPEGTDLQFEGRMDCILQDGEGNLAVIDLKKDASKHHGGTLDKVNLQLAIYAKMLEKDSHFGKRPEIGAFYSFEGGKFLFVWPKFGYNKAYNNFFYDENSVSTDPAPKSDKTEYVEENYNKRVKELDRIVKEHDFAPKPKEANSCKNCSFYNLCREGFQTV